MAKVWRKIDEVSIQGDGVIAIEFENVAEAIGFANALNPGQFTVERLGQFVAFWPVSANEFHNRVLDRMEDNG